MSELIIVVGVMGAGKTTFAKEYAEKHNYEYIDFDNQYHTNIQNEQDIYKAYDFIGWLAYLLNNREGVNFICDSWFGWIKDWWKNSDDITLSELQKRLKHHEIRVIHIIIPHREAYKRYIDKHGEDKAAQEDFEWSIGFRETDINNKILQWATQ